jgi:hypothetical protein
VDRRKGNVARAGARPVPGEEQRGKEKGGTRIRQAVAAPAQVSSSLLCSSLGCRPQREKKRGPVPGFRLHPDAPAVLLHDPLGIRRKADSNSLLSTISSVFRA